MKYLFVLLFFLSTTVFSQKNYIVYHQKIIEAEDLFLKEDFASSIKKYRTIFEHYEKSFVKDVYIAAEIATLAQDSNSLFYFLGLGFKKGLPWRVVEGNSVIASYLSDFPQTTITRLKESFLQGRTYYLNHINISLRYEILLMDNKDQLYHEFPKDVKTILDKDSLYASVVDENLDKIIRIIQEYGYPGEHLIGIKNKNDDNVSHYTLYESDLNEITPIFFYHNDCCFQWVNKELYDAILNGDIHPREYALIYEWSFNGFRYVKDTMGTDIEVNGQIMKVFPSRIPIKPCKLIEEKERYGIHKGIQAYKNAPVSDEKINMDRAKIGIATLAHDKSKKEFEKKYSIKLFFGMFEEL